MPVELFIRYQDKLYDVGTRVKFHDNDWNRTVIEGVVENVFPTVDIRDTNGKVHEYSRILTKWDNVIVEIVEPLYYTGPIPEQDNNRNRPPSWDVEIGWIYYILVMVVGTLFNDRVFIWVVASLIFFAWKNGFLLK